MAHRDRWIADRCASLLDSLHVLVVVLRRDGTIVFFNRTCQLVTGYTAEEAVGQRVWQLLVAPEDIATEREALENASRLGLFTEREVRWISKDGRPRIISWNNQLDSGESELVVDTGIDVTDFRSTEAALQQAKTFVDVLKTIAVGANQASGLAEALMVCVDEITMRTQWKVGCAYLVADGRLNAVAERDRRRGARTVDYQAASAEMAEGARAKRQVVRRPGTATLPAALAFPIFFGDRVIAVFHFVAEGEVDPGDRLIEILSDAEARIGRVVERKIADEERARLLESERAARDAAHRGNVARDLFLASLSHELRTPLTAIQAWAQLLRRGGLDADKQRRAIATIEENAKAQGTLVNDLLDISRIILGKVTLEPRVIDPLPVVRETVEAIRPVADARGVRLEIAVEGAGHVRVDPTRLRQIVLNLLSNAVKFSPSGQKVLVRLASTLDGRYRVSVEDSGIGIAPEFLPRLFEPFSQADASTTRSHGGLGLGLAIAHSLAEMQGGRLFAESAGEGRGATFTLDLREWAGTELPSPERAAPEATRQRAAARDQLKGLNILVVDDVVDSRAAIAMILSSFGASVIEAGSASEAFDALGRYHPDVLVTDIAMPGEDGYSLLRRIRGSASPELRRIPSVALTAYAGREDQERATAAGFQAHIAKPIDVERTIAVLARLTENRAPS